MAVLQNIREKCGVLVIVIVGIALLAFLLGDFLSSGRGSTASLKIVTKVLSVGNITNPVEATTTTTDCSTRLHSRAETLMPTQKEASGKVHGTTFSTHTFGTSTTKK